MNMVKYKIVNGKKWKRCAGSPALWCNEQNHKRYSTMELEALRIKNNRKLKGSFKLKRKITKRNYKKGTLKIDLNNKKKKISFFANSKKGKKVKVSFYTNPNKKKKRKR